MKGKNDYIMPKISVLLAVYNEEKYIEEAVQSVISQTEKDFELIIVDDGSTDNTLSKLMEIKKNDERIKVLSPGKVGKNGAFNLAFSQSKAKLITLFAGDDKMPHNSLECRIQPFEERKIFESNIALYGKLLTMSEDKKYNNLLLPKKKMKGVRTGGTIVFTRSLAEVIFPIPLNYPNEDTWISLNVDYFAKEIIDIPSVLLNYRIHSGNSLKRNISFEASSEKLHSRFLIYDDFLTQHKDYLGKENINNLSSKIKLENLRFNNKTMKILTVRNVSIKEKIRAIFYSNKYLYALKVSLDHHILGRL